jgi:hypothetical protein
MRFRNLAILFLLITPFPIQAEDPSNLSSISAEPAVEKFLVAVKDNQPPKRKFNPADAPSWDITQLLSFVSSGGVGLTEGLSKSPAEYSKQAFENELRQRRGKLFTAIAHIAFLLSKGKPQYSTIKVYRRDKVTILQIATFYELTFSPTPSGLMLTGITDINEGC